MLAEPLLLVGPTPHMLIPYDLEGNPLSGVFVRPLSGATPLASSRETRVFLRSGDQDLSQSAKLLWGAAAAFLYCLVATSVSRQIPTRILYEGETPPPPYHWVAPPPDLAGSNQPAQQGSGSVPIGLHAGQVVTGDGQAIVVLPEGSIAVRPGESLADVKITPLDPTKVAPAPSGLRVDGNAYRMEAVYSASKQPFTLSKPATVVLRYPIHATELLRFLGPGWTSLSAQTIQATLQIFGTTDRLGVFVAAAPLKAQPLPNRRTYLAAAVGLLMAIASRMLPGMRPCIRES